MKGLIKNHYYKDLTTDIGGRDVLIVEDIVDTGLTLSYLIQNLQSRRQIGRAHV